MGRRGLGSGNPAPGRRRDLDVLQGGVSVKAAVSDGKGAGLVVSLTGASLVPMMDNFTPGPFTEELVAAGIPEHLHDWLGGSASAPWW